MVGVMLFGCFSMSFVKFNKICFVRGVFIFIFFSVSLYVSLFMSVVLLFLSFFVGGI